MEANAYVIYPFGSAAIVVWEDGERRDESELRSETAAGNTGWAAAFEAANIENGENCEEIDYDDPPHQIATIVEGWDGYAAYAVAV